jgi:hypothetical protein
MESYVRSGIRWSMMFGLLAILDYFAIAALPIPDRTAIVMASLFGPLLLIGSFALYRMISIHTRSFAAELAMMFNSLAAALVTAMLLVQLAIHGTAEKLGQPFDRNLMREFDSIQLALDVAWDVFISIGTLAFAVAMWKHPRFGKWFAVPGILLAAGLFVLNLATFPIPPMNAGSVDLGPFVGLWYAACSVRGLLSLKWLDNQFSISAKATA